MAALARVGVADYAGQRANTLSGGQQQRGAIARALVQKAKIILADEPVASLDPVAARKVMESLRDLNQQDGLTVVVTLHQVDYALRYCERVVALKAGKIVYDGPADGPRDQAAHRHLRSGIRRRLLGRSPEMIAPPHCWARLAVAAVAGALACRLQPEAGRRRPSRRRSSSRSCSAENQAVDGARCGSRCWTTCPTQIGVKVKPYFATNYTSPDRGHALQAGAGGLVLRPAGAGGGATAPTARCWAG